MENDGWVFSETSVAQPLHVEEPDVLDYCKAIIALNYKLKEALATWREPDAVLVERERCAKLMEQYPGGSVLAEVIRREPSNG